MAIFEIQGPDGKTYEVEAPTAEQAVAAVQSMVSPGGGSSTNPGAVNEFGDKLRAAATGMADGASFGFGDNIAAGIGGVQSMLGGTGFRRGYDETLDIVREGMARDAQANPNLTTGGNIAGAAIPALLSAPLTAGGGLGAAMLKGGGIGGVEGALHAAGKADGEDVGTQALRGGLAGVGFGMAAPVAVAGGRQAILAGTDLAGGGVRALTGRGSQSRANRMIVNTLMRSGRSVDDVADDLARAAREGQPEFVLADALGQSGQRRLSGITRSGGDASQEIAEYLNQRQVDQSDRVAGFVSEAFDGQQTAAARQAALKEARDATATTAYTAARGNAGPVNLTPTLDAIDDALRGVNSLDGGTTGFAETAVGRKLQSVRNQIGADNGSQVIDFELVLETKQDLGRAIERIKGTPGGKVPPAISKVYGELDKALEKSSDMYRTANDGFREASRVIDAVDTGAGMTAPGTRAADNVATFGQMTPDEQAAARAGYGDRVLARIEATAGEGTNRARPLTSAKFSEEAGAIATDPDLLARRVGRENTMFETRARALGGSRTADNLEDIADLNPYDAGMIGNLLSGQFSAAGRQIMQSGANVVSGVDPSTRQIIARALLSNSADPLRDAMKQATTTRQRQQIVEVLLRTMGHQQGTPAIQNALAP